MHVTNNYLGDRHFFPLKVKKAGSLQHPPQTSPLQANMGVITKYTGFSNKAGLWCSHSSQYFSDIVYNTVSNSYLGTDRNWTTG